MSPNDLSQFSKCSTFWSDLSSNLSIRTLSREQFSQTTLPLYILIMIQNTNTKYIVI